MNKIWHIAPRTHKDWEASDLFQFVSTGKTVNHEQDETLLVWVLAPSHCTCSRGSMSTTLSAILGAINYAVWVGSFQSVCWFKCKMRGQINIHSIACLPFYFPLLLLFKEGKVVWNWVRSSVELPVMYNIKPRPYMCGVWVEMGGASHDALHAEILYHSWHSLQWSVQI